MDDWSSDNILGETLDQQDDDAAQSGEESPEVPNPDTTIQPKVPIAHTFPPVHPFATRPAYSYRFKPQVTVNLAEVEGCGRKLRRNLAQVRRHIDSTAPILNHIETRTWLNRNLRNRIFVQPHFVYSAETYPAMCFPDKPVDCVTTRFVRSAMNKVKCPIFDLCVIMHLMYESLRVFWTPEGRRLITGASSGEFTLWNGTAFNFETILQAHDSAVRSMRWSHNDMWMITADNDGFVKYWQANMNNVAMFQAHKECVRDISFSPNDLKFATASDDGTVRVWDFISINEERVLRGHGSDVRAVDWHPQKGLLVSGSRDSQQPVKLWDPRNGQCISTLHCHKNAVLCTQWNQNGNWLLTGSRDHLIKMIDIRMMKELMTFKSHRKEVSAIAWHPFHEGLFVSAGTDGSMIFWHVNYEKELASMENAHDQAIWAVKWHPLGHILASGSNDNNTYVDDRKFWTRNKIGDTIEDFYCVPQSMHEQTTTSENNKETNDDAETATEKQKRELNEIHGIQIPGMGLEADILEKIREKAEREAPALPALGGIAAGMDANAASVKRTLLKKPPPKKAQRQFERVWNVSTSDGTNLMDYALSSASRVPKPSLLGRPPDHLVVQYPMDPMPAYEIDPLDSAIYVTAPQDYYSENWSIDGSGLPPMGFQHSSSALHGHLSFDTFDDHQQLVELVDPNTYVADEEHVDGVYGIPYSEEYNVEQSFHNDDYTNPAQYTSDHYSHMHSGSSYSHAYGAEFEKGFDDHYIDQYNREHLYQDQYDDQQYASGQFVDRYTDDQYLDEYGVEQYSAEQPYPEQYERRNKITSPKHSYSQSSVRYKDRSERHYHDSASSYFPNQRNDYSYSAQGTGASGRSSSEMYKPLLSSGFHEKHQQSRTYMHESHSTAASPLLQTDPRMKTTRTRDGSLLPTPTDQAPLAYLDRQEETLLESSSVPRDPRLSRQDRWSSSGGSSLQDPRLTKKRNLPHSRAGYESYERISRSVTEMDRRDTSAGRSGSIRSRGKSVLSQQMRSDKNHQFSYMSKQRMSSPPIDSGGLLPNPGHSWSHSTTQDPRLRDVMYSRDPRITSRTTLYSSSDEPEALMNRSGGGIPLNAKRSWNAGVSGSDAHLEKRRYPSEQSLISGRYRNETTDPRLKNRPKESVYHSNSQRDFDRSSYDKYGSEYRSSRRYDDVK
ncbi:pre-mRNA 3' end processing protein WDR33 [Trichinella nativa]|uniref:Pre-mRNA 3' end processing protein WDR33 n=1 Tax=Trichinella nativa TaxID=6335 RepID=A0A0V1LJS6_9BILA|nr:pre-mRNA 3' end processing protein WDR33 [Trichinella nativa]